MNNGQDVSRSPKAPTVPVPKHKEPNSNHPRVLLLSFCDGIGVVPHAANLEWQGKVTTYGWEIIDHATSVARHNIPMYHQCGDLLKISNAFTKKILSEGNYDLVLVTAGFPCQTAL